MRTIHLLYLPLFVNSLLVLTLNSWCPLILLHCLHPLDEIISICADFSYRSPLTSAPSFPESVFAELMELATKSSSFNFNDTMHRLVDGISMGSLLGPIIDNIFVGFYE